MLTIFQEIQETVHSNFKKLQERIFNRVVIVLCLAYLTADVKIASSVTNGSVN